MTTYLDIPGFPGYRVGDDGSVWSRMRCGRTSTRFSDAWKRLALSARKDGYIQVNLRRSGKPTGHLLHKLVLTVFRGSCPEGMEGRHLNGVKSECHLGNLAWGTPKENAQDKINHGTQVRGETHGRSKLTVIQVKEILARRGEKHAVIARDFGVSRPHISLILSGKYWSHIKEKPCKS